MSEAVSRVGERPATRVSLSLPEGTAERSRARVGKREFSAFIAEAVERELRGQVLDEYLADYESRKGPVSDEARQGARQVFDEGFRREGGGPRRKLIHEGTLVLHSEGLSKLLSDDERVVALTAEARSRGMEAVI